MVLAGQSHAFAVRRRVKGCLPPRRIAALPCHFSETTLPVDSANPPVRGTDAITSSSQSRRERKAWHAVLFRVARDGSLRHPLRTFERKSGARWRRRTRCTWLKRKCCGAGSRPPHLVGLSAKPSVSAPRRFRVRVIEGSRSAPVLRMRTNRGCGELVSAVSGASTCGRGAGQRAWGCVSPSIFSLRSWARTATMLH